MANYQILQKGSRYAPPTKERDSDDFDYGAFTDRANQRNVLFPDRFINHHAIMSMLRYPCAPRGAAEGYVNGFTRSSKRTTVILVFLALHTSLCNAWQADAFRVSFWWRVAGVAYPQLQVPRHSKT